MKKVFSVVLLFSYATLIHAQKKIDRSYFGLKLGMNSSTNKIDPSTSLDISNKTGFAGGIYYNLGLGRIFSIQPELLYSPVGSEIKTLITPTTEAKFKLDYLVSTSFI